MAYSADVSFGRDGLIPTIAKDLDGASVNLIRSDASGIVVAAAIGTQAQTQFRLERFTLDGRLDPTFTPRDLPTQKQTYQYAFGDRRGRVLVVSYNYVTREVRLLRFNADGTADTAFGGRGSTAFATAYSRHRPSAFHVTDGPDGSIYVSSLDSTDTAYGYFRNVYKFTASGRVDTAFAKNGVLLASNYGAINMPFSVDEGDGFSFHVDNQNRLLIAQMPDYNQFRLNRYLTNGRLDQSYGNKGLFSYGTGGTYTYYSYRTTFDTQGRVLVLSNQNPFDLVRVTDTGHLEAGFGINGSVNLNGNGDTVIVQNDGKIIVQLSNDQDGSDVSFVRLNADGGIDTSFDVNGRADYVQVNRARDNRNLNELTAPRVLTQLADGKLLVGVGTYDGFTLEKVGPAKAAARGTTGRLYLIGSESDDQFTVTQPTATRTRVNANGQIFSFNKAIKGVYALLGNGNNTYTASLPTAQSVVTGKGNDSITTGDGEDTVFTTLGDDTIFTNGGYDNISFRGGDKTINAGAGSGIITGGGSTSYYRNAGTPGRVRVTGETTDDAKQGGWNVDVRGSRVSVSLGGASATVAIEAQLSANLDATAVRSRVVATVTAKYLTYTATTAASRLTANDSVLGDINTGSGDDVISTGEGSDTVYASAGNDRIYGGGGDDDLNGGEGNDILVGGAGNDSLQGGAGEDRLYAYDTVARPLNQSRNALDGGSGVDRFLIESNLDELQRVEVKL